jgi:hypothetical protein
VEEMIVHSHYRGSSNPPIPWKQKSLKQKIAASMLNCFIWGIGAFAVFMLICSVIGIILTGGWWGVVGLLCFASVSGILFWAVFNSD